MKRTKKSKSGFAAGKCVPLHNWKAASRTAPDLKEEEEEENLIIPRVRLHKVNIRKSAWQHLLEYGKEILSKLPF